MSNTDVATTDDTRSVEPLHLELEAQPDNPSTFVGVCVNEELREWLRIHRVTDPVLLISLIRDGRVVERYVERLSQGFTHVVYPAPGRYEVRATVLYSDDAGFGKLKSFLLRRENFTGYTNPVHWDTYDDVHGRQTAGHVREAISGEDPYDKKKTIHCVVFGHEGIDFAVSTEDLYEPELGRFHQYVLNTFFKKWEDTCDWKKKTWIYVPILTLLLPIHYLMKAVAIVICGLLGLVYENGFRHAWKPGRHGGWAKVISPIRGRRTAWLFARERNEDGSIRRGHYQERPAWVWVVWIVGILSLIVASFVQKADSLNFLESLLISTVAVTVIALVWTGIYSFRHNENRKQAAKKRGEQRERGDLDKLMTTLRGLDCSTEELDLDAIIDRRRRNPVVMYRIAKDKRCRPRARV